VSTSDAPDTMHIGELADRAGMSLRTIRHYDEVGLLVPSGRTTGGFRVYTAQDLERLLVIRRMKPLGFTLDEMKAVMGDLEVLDDAAADESARRAARERLGAVSGEATERRQRLVRQLDMADEFIGLLAARRDG
jgi:MerR family copper efflux transcriptional regulator